MHRKGSLISLGLCFGLMGCAAGTSGSSSVTASCDLPTDQTGTLNGRWASAPIPVALHQGDWSSYESSQIAAAVNTWNSFSQSGIGLQLFDNGGGSKTSNISVPASATLCASADYVNGTYNQPIVIYKDATWPTNYPAAAMALTSYCWNTGSSGSGAATAASSSDEPANVRVELNTAPSALSSASSTGSVASTIQSQLRSFTVAITEVNYQYFFVTSEVPDLQTIVLHELGHVLGLNHSCNDSVTRGFPSCTGSGANTLYQSSIMYPVFGFYSDGQGQQRRTLNSDDEGRADCLYQTGT